jgi:hypothetical protein
MENIVKIPVETPEVAQLRDDANGLLYMAEEVAEISSLENESRAVEFLSQVKRRAKIVDAKRKEYVAPMKAIIDKWNHDFKKILSPLEQAEVIVKKGMVKFRDTEDFRIKEQARKEAERVAKEAIAVVTKDVTQENMESAQEAISAVQEAKVEAPKTVQTQSGEARFRRDWKFEVLDASSVPRKYCAPVDSLIRAAVKAGEREIAGVRVYEESTPIILS